MKAIIFSDIHIHIWKKYNDNLRRTKYQLEILESFLKRGFEKDIPIFFGGDFFHSPFSLENELISLVFPTLRRIFNQYPAEFYAISGNHDIAKMNSLKRRSPSYINSLANLYQNFTVLDFSVYHGDGFDVYGIPYLHFNEGLMEYVSSLELNPAVTNILLLHTDFRGQEDTNGIVIGKGEGISEKVLNSKFDLVLAGHVHKPGHLRKNIYSIGAPLQQRLSDMGGSFGYWVLRDDFSLKFKPLRGPEFRYYTNESEINNDTDFWVKEPKEVRELSSEAFEYLDLNDRKRIIKDYLKHKGISSRSKRVLLLDLVNSIEDE